MVFIKRVHQNNLNYFLTNKQKTYIAAGTGSFEFLCPAHTAGNKVTIKGSSNTADLAEVVIAGLAWGK